MAKKSKKPETRVLKKRSAKKSATKPTEPKPAESPTKSNRGGVRPGAGRPAVHGKTVTTTVRLPEKMRDYLGKNPGESLSQAMIQLFNDSRKFKNWAIKN